MADVRYGFGTRMEGVSFDQAIEQVTAALKQEGFGVLSTIDVSKTLREKIGAELRPYVILGACNPGLAHQALQAEPHIGLLLPCNVVVQQADGGVEVSIADPRAMFELVGNAEIDPVAEDAEQRLRRVVAALEG